MSFSNGSVADVVLTPVQWIGRDGVPLDCEEKIDRLNESLAEIRESCQQVFTDALQMGCSEEFMRIVLQNMIASLKRQNERPFIC